MFLGFYEKGDTEITIIDEQKDRHGNLVNPPKVIRADTHVP
jgi:hypothetical protein